MHLHRLPASIPYLHVNLWSLFLCKRSFQSLFIYSIIYDIVHFPQFQSFDACTLRLLLILASLHKKSVDYDDDTVLVFFNSKGYSNDPLRVCVCEYVHVCYHFILRQQDFATQICFQLTEWEIKGHNHKDFYFV